MSFALCYTFHPNRSMGTPHNLSGYWILLAYNTSEGETRDGREVQPPLWMDEGGEERGEWELLLHRDLKWASMREGSATPVPIQAGVVYDVQLSAREMIHMNTKAYPCDSDPNYSQDKASGELQ